MTSLETPGIVAKGVERFDQVEAWQGEPRPRHCSEIIQPGNRYGLLIRI